MPDRDARHHPRVGNCCLFPHRFAVRRSQQRRVPHCSGAYRRPHQIISPAKTSTGFERDLSIVITGFRSLCGQERRSFQSHRAQRDLRFWNLYRGGLALLRVLALALDPSGASDPPPILHGT
jgi:hypothetical protein